MKRVATTLAAYIVIGCVVSTAVAWACALWSPAHSITDGWLVEGSRPEPAGAHHILSWDYEPVAERRHTYSLGFGVATRETWRGGWRWGAHDEELQVTAGWPRRGLVVDATVKVSDNPPGVTLEGPFWRTGIGVPGAVKPESSEYAVSMFTPTSAVLNRTLPITPRWVFMANIAFWGAISWNVWFLAMSARQRLRTTRGLCPCCGYDRGAAVCPECGAGEDGVAKRLGVGAWR